MNITASVTPTPSTPSHCHVSKAIALILAVLGAAGFATTSGFAAPPPVTIAQPVQVQVTNPVEVKGPVDVQGVVGIVEPSRIPYYVQVGKYVNPGSKGDDAYADIPAGKRFIIESMSVFARCPENQFPSVSLRMLVKTGAPATAMQGEVDVVLSFQGAFDNFGTQVRFYVGSQPLRMIVDSTSHTLNAHYFKPLTTGDGVYWINLIGYLEDL